MGKLNFEDIYRDAVDHLGERPTIKISACSDTYSSSKNYAGMIVYHTYGQYKWQQKQGQGVAGGFRGRAFYVLILCTDDWPPHAQRDAGRGMVHDYLYRKYFAMDWRRGKSCCGGFAVRHGETRYSSMWLNMQSGNVHGKKWQSDGCKYLSTHEQSLVDVAIGCWIDYGANTIVEVPDWLHFQLM